MQCPNCGKSERVTIGARQYCSHCGKALDTVAQPAAAPARPVMRDLSGPTQPAPATASTPETATTTPAPSAPAPVTPVAPIIPTSPIVAAASTTPPAVAPAPAAITAPNPAGSFHAGVSAPAGPAVLDLRNAVTPAAAAEPARPDGAPAALPVAPVTANTPAPAPTPAPASTPVVTPAIITRSSDTREQNAQSTPQSSAISKFGSIAKPAPPQLTTQAAPAPAPAPTPAPVTPAAAPAPVATPSPAPSSSLESAIAGVSAVSTKLDQPTELPNAVVTQVDAMASAKLNQTGAPSKLGPDEAMKLAMSTEVKPQFKPATIAAGLAAIIVMGGYIWINNYPKMTVKTAAAKAGIDATIPGYVPSSYSLAAQVAYGPGEITLNFNNATHSENLQIVQRRTSWDSSALLENYVAKTSSQYSAVEGQGLTVYLYGNGEASWVNHGIWYNIDGNNKLSREQLLKIIYSL